MLALRNLTFSIEGRKLFDDASATIPAGHKVGFVGRNGSGKTTLFRLIRGELALDSGEIEVPKRARIGGVAQEAPATHDSLLETVLAADTERAALIAEAESATSPERIAEIHARLGDIDAHSAEARAAAILHGLGFDAEAQARACADFSGGWRMRVALAAVLFTQPDLLLLDEPTNYLDLEGTLWLTEHLKTYPATALIISHDRDLLDDVCDHILHLDRAKLTLWKGNYSGFEKQRRELMAVQAKAAKKQEDKRKHLQEFVDRFRAKATKARQAQSRLKMLEKMEPTAAIVDTDVLPIHLPSPDKQLSPPIIAMERASVGYDARVVLSRLNLSLSNDDRIGLLGANGNGKSTFAKLLAGRLQPMGGDVVRATKLDVGFFAQHQVDDLDLNDTPYRAVARLMPDAPESRVRARAAQMGFSGERADTKVDQLSGGEKARLLMGLSTFHGPHLIILDEPTNHLDIDSRAALVEAINDYTGAVVLVSHDRYLLEACADRLWLVADGAVKEFDGDIDDYTKLVLQASRGGDAAKSQKAAEKKPSPVREKRGVSQKKIQGLEERIAKFGDLIARIDETLADGSAFLKDPQKAAALASQRGELSAALAAAEEEWLALSVEAEGA